MQILIAAFCVSPYAAQRYRAGTKPFNPIVGETYECIREDKGWKFIGEQVNNSFRDWSRTMNSIYDWLTPGQSVFSAV